MIDTTGQQDTMIRSAKTNLPEEPAPIAVYAATPFNANTPASSKQPIQAPAVDETNFKYFQRQVAFRRTDSSLRCSSPVQQAFAELLLLNRNSSHEGIPSQQDLSFAIIAVAHQIPRRVYPSLAPAPPPPPWLSNSRYPR